MFQIRLVNPKRGQGCGPRKPKPGSGLGILAILKRWLRTIKVADDISHYGMSQDNPDVTPLQLCRFDWCVKVPADWKGDGDVDVTDFPACRVAAIRCVGGFSHENKVIQYLFRYWLPRSRYQPANLPGMEIYRRQPAEMGWEEYDIDCAVPVVPL